MPVRSSAVRQSGLSVSQTSSPIPVASRKDAKNLETTNDMQGLVPAVLPTLGYAASPPSTIVGCVVSSLGTSTGMAFSKPLVATVS